MFATGGFSARDLQLDPASPLARLVQDVVRRDQNHFAEAIRAVQAWLSDNADTVVAKPLHRYLGNILSYMFLHSQETGGPMILRADISSQLASSVFDFLRPQTIFLRTLLNLHGRSQLYEVYFDQLPAPTRRLISNMDFTQLPSVYQQRIKGIQPTDGPNALLAGQTRPPPPRQFGAGHLQVSPTKDGSRSTIKIMFNMTWRRNRRQPCRSSSNSWTTPEMGR
ncbi:hypothetical protein BC832DRAFT_103261 [Gaertneriomyces semiglobifer]|nr:hypothetical protein BC832DRAFT_103261 [Gaertneriomyces semiglobifer]